MNYSTAIFLVSDRVRAISVTYDFGENANRTIFKSMNRKISVDDYVVIPTDTRHGMTVCKVVDVDVEIDLDQSATIEWIVGVVDTIDFKDIQNQEAEAIAIIKSAEKRRKRDELRESLIADTGDALTTLPIFDPDKERSE